MCLRKQRFCRCRLRRVPFICCLVLPFLVFPTPAVVHSAAHRCTHPHPLDNVVQAWPQAQRQPPPQQGERCPASISRTQSRTPAGTAPFIDAFCHLICNSTPRLSRCASPSSRRRTLVSAPHSTCPPPTVRPSAKARRAKTNPRLSTTRPCLSPPPRAGTRLLLLIPHPRSARSPHPRHSWGPAACAHLLSCRAASGTRGSS